ncbi:hypothetical protein PR048_009056 [Dryococelus australis]|uniref:Uncharacterized protein n=1 Tax=Dryococelus australis TaxID=614101 RepID=A0ABQ9HYU2_9NEOP|nr:hypothetical protein PR048_009056 [Dryococelus australis]
MDKIKISPITLSSALVSVARQGLDRTQLFASKGTSLFAIDNTLRSSERACQEEDRSSLRWTSYTQQGRALDVEPDTVRHVVQSPGHRLQLKPVQGQWLDYLPPTNVNLILFPAGSLPDFRKRESCRTMPLVSEFSRGTPRPCIRAVLPSHLVGNARLHHRGSKLEPISHLRSTQKIVAPLELAVSSGIFRLPRPFIPALLHTHSPITLIGSQDLAVKSRSNLFTHSLTHSFAWCSSRVSEQVDWKRWASPMADAFSRPLLVGLFILGLPEE